MFAGRMYHKNHRRYGAICREAQGVTDVSTCEEWEQAYAVQRLCRLVATPRPDSADDTVKKVSIFGKIILPKIVTLSQKSVDAPVNEYLILFR